MTAPTMTRGKHSRSFRKNLRLPESAAFTISGGQEFLLLPVADFEAWVEDQLDAAEAKAALADPAPRVSQAEVKRQLGLR